MFESVLKDGCVHRRPFGLGQAERGECSASKVKRIVITSSAAAVLREDPNSIVFTEAEWDERCLEILKKYEDEGGKNEMPNMVKYRAPKTLAEKGELVLPRGSDRTADEAVIDVAAWAFVNDPENKSRMKGDLIALNPPFVSVSLGRALSLKSDHPCPMCSG